MYVYSDRKIKMGYGIFIGNDDDDGSRRSNCILKWVFSKDLYRKIYSGASNCYIFSSLNTIFA